jgi:hypothetical protein
MSSRNKKGAWEVPTEQLKEFILKDVNYDALIGECLRSSRYRDVSPSVTVASPYNKKNSYRRFSSTR